MPTGSLIGTQDAPWWSPDLNNPQQAQQATLTANTANLPSIFNLGNQINANQQGQVNAQYTGFDPLYFQTGANLGRQANELSQGHLPTDVQQMIQQSAAERAVGQGVPGSELADYGSLRTLGLTSLQGINQGANLLGQVNNLTPRASLFNPSSLLITPEQQAQLSMAEARLAAGGNGGGGGTVAPTGTTTRQGGTAPATGGTNLTAGQVGYNPNAGRPGGTAVGAQGQTGQFATAPNAGGPAWTPPSTGLNRSRGGGGSPFTAQPNGPGTAAGTYTFNPNDTNTQIYPGTNQDNTAALGFGDDGNLLDLGDGTFYNFETGEIVEGNAQNLFGLDQSDTGRLATFGPDLGAGSANDLNSMLTQDQIDAGYRWDPEIGGFVNDLFTGYGGTGGDTGVNYGGNVGYDYNAPFNLNDYLTGNEFAYA